MKYYGNHGDLREMGLRWQRGDKAACPELIIPYILSTFNLSNYQVLHWNVEWNQWFATEVSKRTCELPFDYRVNEFRSTKKLGLLEQHLLIEAYFNGMVAYPWKGWKKLLIYIFYPFFATKLLH